MTDKLDQEDIETLITELLDKMPLEDRVNIANLSDDDIHVLESIMCKHLKSRYSQLSMEESMEDTEEAQAILKEVWKRLKETHRLRVVK